MKQLSEITVGIYRLRQHGRRHRKGADSPGHAAAGPDLCLCKNWDKLCANTEKAGMLPPERRGRGRVRVRCGVRGGQAPSGAGSSGADSGTAARKNSGFRGRGLPV